MKRTEEEIVTQSPLTVILGGKKWDIPILNIRESKAWRKAYTNAIVSPQRHMKTTSDDIEKFEASLDAILCGMPDAVADLFFMYAKDLNREEIETIATDMELSEAFKAVCKHAFPLAQSLLGSASQITG